MEVKEYLEQAFWIDRNINLDIELVKDMKSSLCGRSSLSECGHSSSKSNSTEKTLVKIVDFEKRINDEIDMLINKKIEIESNINCLESWKHSEVLKRRYVMLMTWDEIAKSMNYSKQHVQRLHKSALQKMRLNVTQKL